MPINAKEFLDGVAIIADNHNVRVTLKQSGKGAIICGVCCFIGGVIAGPPGLAVGGTVGGITAYRMSSSKYPPAWFMNCLLLCLCLVGGILCGPIGWIIGLIVGGWMKQNFSKKSK